MGLCWGSPAAAEDPSVLSAENQQSEPGTSTIQSNGVSSLSTSSAGTTGKFSELTTSSRDVPEEGSNPGEGHILATPNLKKYTFADLKIAARNFKSDSLLGQGGFGKVFKGWVDEKTLAPAKSGGGMMVAIKKLNSDSCQGFEEWQSEVNFLGRLSHPNLVRLLGYCWEEKELLLVYEFMQRGSLENHLFRRSSAVEPIAWDIRLKIAIGAARGLAFLHTSEKQVIYRDFKASNILLDGNYNAKISDFGLAKLGPSGGDTHVSTRVMGTYGYAAPEYIATGHLYIKSDVYGFGVVLLEILMGKRAFDRLRPQGQQNLSEWAMPYLAKKEKIKRYMDERMEGQYLPKAAFQAAQLALKCLNSEPRNRPSMEEVVVALETIRDIPKETKSDKGAKTPTRRPAHQASHHSRQGRIYRGG